MLKEKFDKIKSMIVKDENGNSKKKIENLVVFVIILIITIIIINYVWNGEKKDNVKNKLDNEQGSYKQLASDLKATSNNSITTKTDLEQKLEDILSKIDGVGKVNVLITYSQSSEIVAMFNEMSKTSSTQEEDSEGGIRKINETDTTKEVIYTQENGVNVPVTQKVINPTIEGAIITAIGANNATTKTNIIQAVEAVTGLATHKIQVFEMKIN